MFKIVISRPAFNTYGKEFYNGEEDKWHMNLNLATIYNTFMEAKKVLDKLPVARYLTESVYVPKKKKETIYPSVPVDTVDVSMKEVFETRNHTLICQACQWQGTEEEATYKHTDGSFRQRCPKCSTAEFETVFPPIVNETKADIDAIKSFTFKPKTAYAAKHGPTGETWYIIGIDLQKSKVCAAGWPPSIGELSDCSEWEERSPLNEEELKHREKEFKGYSWL